MRKFTNVIPYTEFVIADGNYDTSRVTIDRIVIHSTVGSISSAISRFSTSGTQVSAHYIIGNDSRLWAGLEEYWTAYHSGNYSMNQRSIGIEHEWYQGLPPSTAMYETSAKLVVDICKYYNMPIDREHIIPHKDIVPTGCPNEVSVDRIIERAQEISTNPNPPLPPPSTDSCQLYKNGISFRDKVIGERDLEIQQLKDKIANLLTENSTLNLRCFEAKKILYGKGWPWVKNNKLKVIFPN